MIRSEVKNGARIGYSEIENVVNELKNNHVHNRSCFLQFVKNVLPSAHNFSVKESTLLLAGLDIAGKSILSDLETLYPNNPYQLVHGDAQIAPTLTEYFQLAICEYLADEFRAIRRERVWVELGHMSLGRIDESIFNSVFRPLLDRNWIPLAWYSPYQILQCHLTKDDLCLNYLCPKYPLCEKVKLKQVDFFNHNSDRLRLNSRDITAYINAIKTRSEECPLVQETAAYIDSFLQVKRNNLESAEYPIMFVDGKNTNFKKHRFGHIIRALLVPFPVSCTNGLSKSSLEPAKSAVQNHFGDSYWLKDNIYVIVGDYPGGVHCQGSASCAIQQKQDCQNLSLKGPSAGLSLGILLTSKILALETKPNIYATAKIDRWGGIQPLHSENLKAVYGQTEDSLQVKGRCAGILTYATQTGVPRVLVADNEDRNIFYQGIKQFTHHRKYLTEYFDEFIECLQVQRPDPVFNLTPIVSLDQAIQYTIPNMYKDVVIDRIHQKVSQDTTVKRLSDDIIKQNQLLWIVNVPDTKRFGNTLSTKIRNNKINENLIPICISVKAFCKEYQLGLGEIFAKLSGIDLPVCDNKVRISRIHQIEKDIQGGRLILIFYDFAERVDIFAIQLLDTINSIMDRFDHSWKLKVLILANSKNQADTMLQMLKTQFGFEYREV